MKVVQTGEGWIVKTSYDGRRLAGPFPSKIIAREAEDRVIPAVVRAGRASPGGKAGYFLANEDTGARLGSDIYPTHEDAVRARDKNYPPEPRPEPVASEGGPAAPAQKKRGTFGL